MNLLFFAFILAQSTDLASVPAEVLKWTIVVIVSIVLIACAIWGAWSASRKPAPIKLNDEPPITVRKAPKRYNHDATEQRFVQVEQRLDAHDAELDELRAKQSDSQVEIQRSLGRIEGRLGITPTK